MHDQPSPAPADEETETDFAILALLLDPEIPGLWSADEITREIGKQNAVRDGLVRLHGAGLVHRCGEFVFPTRAAARFDQLA